MAASYRAVSSPIQSVAPVIRTVLPVMSTCKPIDSCSFSFQRQLTLIVIRSKTILLANHPDPRDEKALHLFTFDAVK